jgi:DNA-directed RNA polymerase subunit RPC12/RpoP
MAIKTECSKCGQSFSAQDSLHFKTVQCPSCGHKTQVVTAVEARIAAAAQERERKEEETKRAAREQEKTRYKAQCEAYLQSNRELHKTGPIITRNDIRLAIAIISTICFLATIQQPPSLLILVNYLALATACILWVGFVWNRIESLKKRSNWILNILRVFLVILAFYLYYQVDYYDKRTRLPNGGTKKTTYHRGGAPTYNYIITNTYCFHGPLSSSGELHGRWAHWDMNLDEFEYIWYWYGEKVSEGDWRRFNK